MTKIKIIVGVIIMVFLGYGLAQWYHDGSVPEANQPLEQTQQTPKDEGTTVQKQKMTQKMNQLQQKLEEIISQDSAADYGVYVAWPECGQPVIINNRKQSAASVIKIYILGTAYNMVAQGDLSLDTTLRVKRSDMVGGAGVINGYGGEPVLTIRELLKLMIIESDNTATNVMIDYLGMNRINQYIQAQGYGDTILQRKMMDTASLQAGRDNFTTVQDVGTFFDRLLAKKLVNETLDQEMLDIFKEQTDKECINTALAATSNLQVAHKTGELIGVYHDAGIVYHGQDGYVEVLFSENSNNRDRSIRVLRKIAQQVDRAYQEQ